MLPTAHYERSSAREKLIEYLFVGDLLRHLWIRGIHEVECLSAAVDHAGYDVVFDCCGILRHVQLKASSFDAKTARQKINQRLARKVSGCVIWIVFDPETLDLGPFLWFGGRPGQPLPSLDSYPLGKHTKANVQGFKAERPNIRVVSKGCFDCIPTMGELVERLFGDAIDEVATAAPRASTPPQAS